MIYASQFGGWRTGIICRETGSKFWLALTKTEPPLVDRSNAELLVCPDSGLSPDLERTSYRGPMKPLRLLGDLEVMGCCEPGCHPGDVINVLLRSGDVVEAGPSDPLHAQALQGTLK